MLDDLGDDGLEPRFRELGTVRPGWAAWPSDKPFPWSDAECAAFVRGHFVKWPHGIGELWYLLPGHVELIDGYAVQKT